MIAHYEEKPILFTLWGSDVDVSNEKGWEMVDKHIRQVSQIYGLEYVYIQSSFRKMIDEMILNLEIGKIAHDDEYYGAAEPPVRCGESHLSGLTEPPVDSYSA